MCIEFIKHARKEIKALCNLKKLMLFRINCNSCTSCKELFHLCLCLKMFNPFIFNAFLKLNMSINSEIIMKTNTFRIVVFVGFIALFSYSIAKRLLNSCFIFTINEANMKQVLNKCNVRKVIIYKLFFYILKAK